MQSGLFMHERECLVRIRENLGLATLAAYFLGDVSISPREQAALEALTEALAAIEVEIAALDLHLTHPDDSYAAWSYNRPPK